VATYAADNQRITKSYKNAVAFLFVHVNYVPIFVQTCIIQSIFANKFAYVQFL